MSRMLAKLFWAVIGLVIYFILSFIGIDVAGSSFGGILFIGIVLVIWFIIKNSNT